MPASRPQWIQRLDDLHLLTPLIVVAIVVVALVASQLVRVAVARALRHTIDFPGADRARAEARQQALGSVLRSALVGVVWAVAVITIVGEVGVNIGGLLATATIVGGAIAFGAQSLVRDLVAGFFMLAEDQYGVGDHVDLGLASGVVERITLRSVRLRDGAGRVWYVPHGNVDRVANLSKLPLAVLDVEVARESDADAARAVMERMLAAMTDDAAVGAALTGAPQIVGVAELRDDRLVLRATVATYPGRQEDVRRWFRTASLAEFRSGALTAPPAAVAPGRAAQS